MVVRPVYVGYNGTCSLYNTMSVEINACNDFKSNPINLNSHPLWTDLTIASLKAVTTFFPHLR
jgi:hypothetical protein